MLLTTELLDTISAEAKASLRLRLNFNLHGSVDEPVQRMLNAMEPGTVVPIHRHLKATETIIVIRGKLKVFYYDDDKKQINSVLIEANSNSFGIHIPKGVWHNVDVLETKTVIFEVKEGPYAPLTETDILS